VGETGVVVNMLDRLETRLERIVEGSVGALFRTPLQPAEIGGNLERAMLAGQVAGPAGRIGSASIRRNSSVSPITSPRFAGSWNDGWPTSRPNAA
jgi:hypothetical protein